MESIGFAILIIGLASVDTYVHLKGRDTYLWSYKTPEEKELQKIRIEKEKCVNDNSRTY